MIEVKQIAKPKNSSGSGTSTGGGGYGSIGKMTEEAKHAAKADLATHAEQAEYADRAGYASRAAYSDLAGDVAGDSPINDRFLSKITADRAAKKISFDEGIELGNFAKGEQGGLIDGNGNAELLTMIVRKLISSAHYTSGFNGEGYRLWIDKDGLSNLELDKLTVRQIMTVFELIIDRIRAVGGQIVVSAANGKIKAVEDTGEAYKIYFEGDNYFQPNDLMRCQVFKGENIRSYWVEIVGAYSDYIVVAKSEFEVWATEPQEGDEVVLMGNTENTKRQNLISISATEDGEPRIDVLDGVKAKNFNGALRARLGDLDGITDDWFPLNNQPHGNGLYADNVYLRGSFLLTTGEDIKTKFDIVEGKISSSVEAVRQDFMQEKGYLNNPTFGDGLSHWTAENATTFFFLGNKWIWANDNVLTKKGDGASLTTDDGRVVVRIKNKYICQKYADFRAVPEIKTNEDGKKEPTPVYLSFFYKVKKKGILTIGFENINNDGFIDYEPLSYSQELDATATYQQLTISGLWNATGDFKLSFTGEMFVYMFVLSTDRIESLTHTYRTLFEQSDKLVKIAAMNFDKDGNILESSGIITTSNFAGMFASAVENDTDIVKKADISAFIKKDENGNIESGVHIGADNISLEGIVTANNNFKVNTDGTIECTGAKISGEVNATSGTFKGRIEASSGAFVGEDGLYKFVVDIDNRVIKSFGPDVVDNDMKPTSTSRQIEHVTLLDFESLGGSINDDGTYIQQYIVPYSVWNAEHWYDYGLAKGCYKWRTKVSATGITISEESHRETNTQTGGLTTIDGEKQTKIDIGGAIFASGIMGFHTLPPLYEEARHYNAHMIYRDRNGFLKITTTPDADI